MIMKSNYSATPYLLVCSVVWYKHGLSLEVPSENDMSSVPDDAVPSPKY